MNLEVKWIDRYREPTSPSDPKYPDGMDLDLSQGRPQTCSTQLKPYPTPRCGLFLVQCGSCGSRTIITTAGRPDDPRSVILPCKRPYS